jgi:predicted ATP-grasp superfamily ATP-dependent carboligase
VLVTDGDNRAALAIVRSLGRAGHEVVVGEKRAPALAQVSRYCSRRFVYPDPVSAPDEFMSVLVEAVRDRQVEALLPVSDITTMLVTEHRDRFGRSCAVPFARHEVIQRAADKVDVLQTAARLGIPAPRSIVVHEGDGVPDVSFEFPVVVKPSRSRVRTAMGWVSTSVSFASDPAQLARDIAQREGYEFPLLLQERIAGPGTGVFACYLHGRAAALFSHRRLRERPPWGGVSVLAESVPLDPFARDCALRLLDELGWNGVAMVEFKRDLRDGLPKLMEINGRFWGSLQLAIDAGVDFPSILLAGLKTTAITEQADYRVGIRNRWLWGDVDSLLVTLRGGSRMPQTMQPSRFRALYDFSKFWSRDLRYENPRVDDLKPWMLESYRWFERLFQNALGPSGGGAGKVTDHARYAGAGRP